MWQTNLYSSKLTFFANFQNYITFTIHAFTGEGKSYIDNNEIKKYVFDM